MKFNNGYIPEEELIGVLKEMGAMNSKKEKKYHELKDGLKITPLSIPVCLDDAGVKIDDYLLAQKIIRGEKPMPKRKISRTPISAVVYDNYRACRHWIKQVWRHPKDHLGAIGMAAVIGAYGLYSAVSVFDKGLSESEVHKVIYNGIDESNWISEENRQQHIRNLEARLSSIKECRDLGDSSGIEQNERLLGEYISSVGTNDPSYSPILDQKLEELRVKYNLK
jgi:hypothetical protein